MKKIVCLILALLTISPLFAGCANKNGRGGAPRDGAAEGKRTAAEELESLFTTIDLMDATISELEAEMEAGNLTSAKLTRMYIDRIEAYDKREDLNSVLFINPNAIGDAEALDREREEGSVRGPLHGIPIIVKANIDVEGLDNTSGSGVLLGMTAAEDAFVVKKLKDAGAVIIAQANLSEFAYSSTSSRSTLGGRVHNAYDTARTSAGSSGGTAVAVTCNFAAAGVGTDTGGSVRNPSSFANLYGIRPSKGLTSTDGVLPLKTYRDTVGPMARTAEDTALLLEIMAGTDENDDYTVEADADSLAADGYTDALSADGLKGVRIGYLRSSFDHIALSEGEGSVTVSYSPDEKVKAMLEKTFSDLIKAGAVFVDLSESLTNEAIAEMSEGVYVDSFEYDFNRFLKEKGDAAPYKTLKEILDTASPLMYKNLSSLVGDPDELASSFELTKNPYTAKVGAFQRIAPWRRILESRAAVERIMEESGVDAVMYLAFFDVAPKDDMSGDSKRNPAKYDSFFGPILGLPEVSLPMGLSATDEECPNPMPLGISVFAGFGDEETLMKIAYAYEQEAKDRVRRAPELTPALEDPALTGFLFDLIDRAYSIDYPKYGEIPEGKVALLMNACGKAMDVDTKDPYATYEAALRIAEAYDKVMLALEGN